MSEQKYELAFYGKLVAGASLQQTKEQVAQLFKTSIDQIERMFTGNRVVIRNKLDQDTALKYIVALKKRGALCQVEEMGQPGIAVSFEPASAPPEAPAAPTSTTTSATASSPTPAPSSSPTPSPEKTEEPAGQTQSNQPVETAPEHKTSAKASMSLTGLPIVGEKVDDILKSAQFDLAPVGVRLGDEKKDATPELHALDDVSLAPVGSDLVEHKEEPPVAEPDISHIKLSPKD